ncbi:MAG TPA: MOSC domain-containing protein [Methylomirabilota bacterium]|nr:MOSC domain-containing protein [Methylomirabilota bacterium]
MKDAGRIAQISVSPGGVPKRPVEAADVTTQGVSGDAQRDREHHGGPERAVCLFSMEAIRDLRAEGHPIEPGHIGENVTLEGLDWDAVTPGTRLRLGADVLLEITRYTSPCHNIRGSFAGGDVGRVSQKKHPGWSRVYARVLRAGAIRRGDPVRLVAG